MKYKALIHHTYTKRDVYGNVYSTVTITNPATGKSITTATPGLSNIRHVLDQAFTSSANYYTTESCTESARLSSLPEHLYLNCCTLDENWKTALRSIGYRLPKTKGPRT